MSSARGVRKWSVRASSKFSVVWSVRMPGFGPRLLSTRMSGAGQAARSAARPASVVMSAATATTSRSMPGRFRRSAAVFSSFSTSRPLTTRWTPSSARASAHARPSPWLDAQTMPRRPAMPRSMSPTLDTPDVARQRKVLPSAKSRPRRGNDDGTRSRRVAFARVPRAATRFGEGQPSRRGWIRLTDHSAGRGPARAVRRHHDGWRGAHRDALARRCAEGADCTDRRRSTRVLAGVVAGASAHRRACRSTRRTGERGPTCTWRSGATACCSTT